jgi:ABC-type nickel/cobalt efflux system permease component RcnA
VTEEQAAQKKRNDPTSQLARGELVHAEVKPLDLSGIPSVIAGIIAWAIAFVVVLIFRDELKKDGLEWWLWVTVAGFGLGLIGLWYCRRRWAAIQAGHRSAVED